MPMDTISPRRRGSSRTRAKVRADSSAGVAARTADMVVKASARRSASKSSLDRRGGPRFSKATLRTPFSFSSARSFSSAQWRMRPAR